MRATVGSVMVAALLGGFAGVSAQLPPEILADRYLVEAEQLIAKKEFGKSLRLMNKIIALQQEHNFTLPDVFHFKYAELALSAGSYSAAIDSVNKYLGTAGRDGEFYRQALELLVQAEGEAEAERRRQEAERRRQEAERRRQEAERQQVQRQVEAAALVLPRDKLNSGGLGPEMITVASGRFQYRAHQGSVSSTHLSWVAFDRPFAIGKFEVTRGEFGQFIRTTGYRTEAERDPKYGCDGVNVSRLTKNSKLKWSRPGFDQTDKHPVTCVSIRDAMAYARWLSQETGHNYRVPSPSEWQYAARAGSLESSLYIGKTDPAAPSICRRANVDDCSNGVEHTAEVGQLLPNNIGVHDMIGNVAEWVLACVYIYDKGESLHFYRLAPHGLAENPDDCEDNVVAKGAAWYHAGEPGKWARYTSKLTVRPNLSQGKDYYGDRTYLRNSKTYVGFRVVKDLEADPAPR